MTQIETFPQRRGKSQLFWERIRKELEANPCVAIKVTIYNHPTLAYRARRDINSGLNPVFPEVGQWNATVFKNESSGFLGPRSGKLTYKYELFLTYNPPVGAVNDGNA